MTSEVHCLTCLCGQGEQAREELAAVLDVCCAVRAGAYAAAERLQRLFFLQEGEHLGRFLVTDLGIIKYPTYK